LGNKENKEVHGKAKKPVSEADKEVLENIMEELEKEAEEKEEKVANETASEENVTEAEAETSEETKKEKKDPLKEKIDELNDKVMRQMAEFENFRKRTDKEKAQMFEQGQANVLEKLLPVVDNFERGLAAVPEADKDGAFADGLNKIYKQLRSSYGRW
jgi:molecular chaperone GrpE